MPSTPPVLCPNQVEPLLKALKSDKHAGLALELAKQRLKEEGANEISAKESTKPFLLFLHQFKSSVVLLLIVAAILSASMQEYLQTTGIVIALILNALIGFITEYRAQISLNTLVKMSGTTVRVRRAGAELDLPIRDLVRGDIVLLEPGSRVPADLRLLETASLSVDESALTGESTAAWKEAGDIAEQDEYNEGNILPAHLLFQGSSVLSGRALGVVIATANNTKLGKLGGLLETVSASETPLTKSLDVLGHQLTVTVLVLSSLFAALGVMRHLPLDRMAETSIALAVAAIPEGLPVIATLALAAGIRRMVKAKAIVRQLRAVETLGCTTIICTDKTGTLTENKMLVTELILAKGKVKLSGQGYDPQGEHSCHSGETEGQSILRQSRSLDQFLNAICLCNDARLENHGGTEGWHIHGDPTEGSLLTAAVKLGKDDEALRNNFPRLGELPFDLSRKRMSTLHQANKQDVILYCKGSPEKILSLCTTLYSGDEILLLTEEERIRFKTENDRLAALGLRVLAVAMKDIDDLAKSENAACLEKDLTLLGLVAMSDRPKEKVREAIKSCQSAGIKIVMLTGDQMATAQAVATELGISKSRSVAPGEAGETGAEVEETAAEAGELHRESSILSGEQISILSQQELKKALSSATVLARVTPEMKLQIVRCFQDLGYVVAMTGDGINDAPALRQSNIGVAMGQCGTDMAREAADLVITDDNFATIVKAIEQGRITYANINRAIGYLLTGSLTSVIAITLGLLANSGLFLQPLQLLYLNFIMHVFPGLGIVLQTDADELMQKPPRSIKEKLLNKNAQGQILMRSSLLAAITLLAVFIDQQLFAADSASTVALATLALALIMQSWAWLKIGTESSICDQKWYLNKPMLITTGINLILLGLAIYCAPLPEFLNTKALNIEQVCLVITAACISFLLSLPIKNWRVS